MPTFDVSSAQPGKAPADCLIVPFFQGRKPGPGFEAVARALRADLTAVLKDNQVTGRSGDTFLIPVFGRIAARNVLLVGLGPREAVDPGAIRQAVQRASRQVARFSSVATTLTQVGDSPEETAHAFAEGVVLAAYQFDRYKRRPIEGSDRRQKPKLKKAVVLADEQDAAALKAGLRRGRIYAEAANWARDLVNTPALDATPDLLAQEAVSMAERYGLRSRIWTKAELEEGGFGGIVGVGAGSANEPRLIELEYQGGSGRPIAITGKGITFDSGGLSIKPADGMETMKDDMSGAAATLATMRAMAQLKPNVNVIAAIPSAENMPGGSAIRPGDVLRHYGGKTSEVLNTDAEGRLVLADALAYLAEKKPVAIIDSATLTGAAMIALGSDIWAVMGSDRQLIQDLLEAGREEGEPGWELPLWTEYRRKIESTVADVKNVGDRWGGAITAALFLKEFVGDIPWAHLDVAGTAFVSARERNWPRGATGSPARTIIRYIDRRAAGDGARPR